MVYNGNGELKAKYTYDAFGNCKTQNPDGTINTDPTFIGNINPFRYRSYYYDQETRLYYLNTRYYDPEVGRFISPDSTDYLDPESINGLNLYAYCLNNPIMYYDPDGHFALFIALGYLLFAVIGVALIAMVEVNFHPIENTFRLIGDGFGIIGNAIGDLTSSWGSDNTLTSVDKFNALGDYYLPIDYGNILFKKKTNKRGKGAGGIPHRTLKNGKSRKDKHTKRRSGAPEKKDKNMFYIIYFLFGIFDDSENDEENN